jgi:hypothetical protein
VYLIVNSKEALGSPVGSIARLQRAIVVAVMIRRVTVRLDGHDWIGGQQGLITSVGIFNFGCGAAVNIVRYE